MRCGESEFRFIERSGLYFGLLLGFIQAALVLTTALLTTALLTMALLTMALWLQAAIWLFVNEVLKGCALRHEEWIGADGESVRECGLYPGLPTWWFLPLAGALCGYATNLIAMWLIFKPIEPTTYLGCFTLHGLFLRRQDQACPYHGCTYYGPFPEQRSQAFGGAPTVCTLHALTMHSPCTSHALTMCSLPTPTRVRSPRSSRPSPPRDCSRLRTAGSGSSSVRAATILRGSSRAR